MVLNSTLEGIVRESWPVGEDRPIKGYELKITTNQEELISFTDGNITRNYKGAIQLLPFPGGTDSIDVFFRAYY